MPFRSVLSFVLAASLIVGCKRPEERTAAQSTDAQLPPGHIPVPTGAPTGLEPGTQALLDSGNAAFRQKDFEGALAYYAKARDAQPDHAAPWFGTYMVAQATKNTALADSAMRMVRARAPELQEGIMPTPGAVPGAAGEASPHYSPHQAPSATKKPSAPPARS